MYYFEDFAPGNRYDTQTRTITETDILNFVGLSGLFEEMFVSDEAARASVWGKKVAPSPLTLAVAEGLVYLAGLLRHGMAQLHLDVSVLAPVFVGDTLRVQVEVVERRETKKPDRGVVRFRHTLVNQAGAEVMRYEVTRMVRRSQ